MNTGSRECRGDDERTADLRDRLTVVAITMAATEQKLRTRGPWLIGTGIIVILLTMAVAIIWHTGRTTPMPSSYVLPLYGIGFGALCLGVVEHVNRPSREAHRLLVNQIERMESGLRELADQLPEEARQRWYSGYTTGALDARRMTGTDHARGSAEVLHLRPGGPKGHPSR